MFTGLETREFWKLLLYKLGNSLETCWLEIACGQVCEILSSKKTRPVQGCTLATVLVTTWTLEVSQVWRLLEMAMVLLVLLIDCQSSFNFVHGVKHYKLFARKCFCFLLGMIWYHTWKQVDMPYIIPACNTKDPNVTSWVWYIYIYIFFFFYVQKL